jgi:predicted Zn-dependent protease
MMFKAKYYNRPSVSPIDAQVRITFQKLTIEYYKNQVFTTSVFNTSDIDRVDKISDTCYIIAFKGKPIQSLEFSSNDFLKELQVDQQKIKSQVKSPSKVIWIFAAISIGFIALLAFLYWAVLPVVVDKVTQKLPKQFETELGSKLFRANLASLDIDSSLTVNSQQFFNAMIITSDTIVITVVKSSEINAYAMPGGYIVVYDSIIKIMKGADEYAALLAHEYAHIKFRHALRGMVRQITGSALIGLLVGDSGGALAILATQADKLKGLQYSREMEQQADEEAVKMLYKSGIDPNGALELFSNMKASIPQANQQGFEFISTHPLFTSRENHIKTLIKNLPPKTFDHLKICELWEKRIK